MGIYDTRENFVPEIFCVLKILGIFMKWKKGIEQKIKKYTKEEISKKEKIPAIVKRCPKCHKLTLEFNPETGKIYCTSCGFEEFIPQIK